MCAYQQMIFLGLNKQIMNGYTRYVCIKKLPTGAFINAYKESVVCAYVKDIFVGNIFTNNIYRRIGKVCTNRLSGFPHIIRDISIGHKIIPTVAV